ncbi:hypothetical protein GCM10023238_08250 [Streptomyces heliomycini]
MIETNETIDEFLARHASDVEELVRKAAAKEIVPRWRRLADHEVDLKSGPHDLVTDADRNAELYLTDALAALLPGSVVVGEEAGARQPGVVRGDTGRGAGVDRRPRRRHPPVRARRHRLLHPGRPRTGRSRARLLDLRPARDQFATAVRGQGAHLDGERLRAGSPEPGRDPPRGHLPPDYTTDEQKRALLGLWTDGVAPRACGSAGLEYLALARGEFRRDRVQLGSRVGTTRHGLLLVEEAGGAHLTRAGRPFGIRGGNTLPFTAARDAATAAGGGTAGGRSLRPIPRRRPRENAGGPAYPDPQWPSADEGVRRCRRCSMRVVVGAGPNGLTAAVELARRGFSVALFEAKGTVGGGSRTEELTLPGFRHDPCAAAHPLAVNSPAFRALPLDRYGLEWLHPELPMAHPFPDGTAAVRPGRSGRRPPPSDRATPAPNAASSPPSCPSGHPGPRFMSLPLTALPRDPVTLARFGLAGLPPSTWLTRRFRDERARTLFAGLVAHVMAPLGGFATGAVGWSSPSPRTPAAGRRPGRLPGRLRRPRRVSRGPRRQHPHRLRGQAPSTTCRRPGRTSSTPRPPPWPASRASATTTRTTAYAASQDRLRAGTAPCRTMDRAPEPVRPDTVQIGADSGEIALALRASASPRGPRPRRALPHHRAARRRRPTGAPAGKHVFWAYGHVPERLDRRPHDASSAQLERYAPASRRRVLAAPRGTPELAARQRQSTSRRHRLRARSRTPAPAAPQTLPVPLRDPHRPSSSDYSSATRPARMCTVCRTTRRRAGLEEAART